MLSAVIIAKNEAKLIGDALKSLDFADEILVIDSGSTDATADIARQHGARVVPVSGSDYSQFRDAGLQAARGDWLLYVDADERVTPGLRAEIISTLKDPGGFSAFALPRENVYLGKHLRFGGWGGDYVIRLFVTQSLSRWQGALHEQPVYSGSLKKLTQPLVHYSHRDLSSMVDKTLNFTAYEARLRFAAGHPPVTWWRFFRVMFTEFWHRFVILSAWRDGPEGIIDGLFQVYNTFIIYARLWEMQYESGRL